MMTVLQPYANSVEICVKLVEGKPTHVHCAMILLIEHIPQYVHVNRVNMIMEHQYVKIVKNNVLLAYFKEINV